MNQAPACHGTLGALRQSASHAALSAPSFNLPQQNGVLGLGHEKDQQPRRPSRVRGLSDVRQISAGWKHNAAVTDGGLLYTWGWGGSQGGCFHVGWTKVGDAKNSRQPSAAGTY